MGPTPEGYATDKFPYKIKIENKSGLHFICVNKQSLSYFTTELQQLGKTPETYPKATKSDHKEYVQMIQDSASILWGDITTIVPYQSVTSSAKPSSESSPSDESSETLTTEKDSNEESSEGISKPESIPVEPEVVPEPEIEAIQEVVPETVQEVVPETVQEVVPEAEVVPEVVPEAEAVQEVVQEVVPEAEAIQEVIPETDVEPEVEEDDDDESYTTEEDSNDSGTEDDNSEDEKEIVKEQEETFGLPMELTRVDTDLEVFPNLPKVRIQSQDYYIGTTGILYEISEKPTFAGKLMSYSTESTSGQFLVSWCS